MHDIIPLIMSYIRGIWRYRWYMLLQAWVLCVVGWSVVLFLPNQYESSAQVFVDTKTMLKPLLHGLAVQTDVQEQVALMTKKLLSRSNLENVIRKTDLDLTLKDEQEKESLIKSLEQRIKIRRSGGQNLYLISYTNHDPQKAHDVVKAMLTFFEEGILGARRDDTNRAQQFLEEQISTYEARLEEAENRLKEFKQKNVGVMPSEGRGYYERLEQAKVEYKQAQLALNEAVRRRDALRRQISGEMPSFGFAESSEVTSNKALAIANRISALEQKLDNMLLQFTSQHPDVIALKKTIEELEQQKAEAERESISSLPTGNNVEVNPVYQRMKISLSEAEADVASLSVRTREFRNRVEHLEQLMNTIPAVEANLAKLNRDYDITKRQYEALLSRRESAMISKEVEKNEDRVKFQTIEPPIVPKVPVAPNRPLMLTAVLIASLALGIALAFFIEQIRPTFDNRRKLAQISGLPVLGSVSLVLNSQQKSRRVRGIVYYALALVMLLGVYMTIQLTLAADVDFRQAIVQFITTGSISNG